MAVFSMTNPGHAKVIMDGQGCEPAGACLASRIAKGDHASLDALYARWFDRGVALVRRLTGRDEAFCMDVVQEAFLRVVRKPPSGLEDESLDRWMIKTLRSAAVDLIRGESRRRERENRSGRSWAALQEVGVEQSHVGVELGNVKKVLEDVGSDEHVLVWLRLKSEVSLETAGAAAGMSGDAAHGKLRRLFLRLRAAWKGENP